MADYARAETFRRLRGERHLTQEEAAHELKVSVKTIRLWEKGAGITWKNAKRVATFYDVAPESLVDRELDPHTANDRLSSIEKKLDDLVELFSSLDARLRAADVGRRLSEDPPQSREDPREAEGH